MDITSDPTRTLVQPLVAELCTVDGISARVLTDLSYDPRDPFAVSLVFRTQPRPVRWTFGRALLTDGLVEATGDGDVHVWPCLDDSGLAVVMVELCSPDGDVLVQLRSHDVVSFLDRTEAVVPTGQESDLLDVDAAIAACFAADLR
jgi:hypothetical protein